MAQLVIDNLEDEVRDKLQDLARDHGRSVEEEALDILRHAALTPPGDAASFVPHDADPARPPAQLADIPPVDDEKVGLGTRLARLFAGIGLDHEIPELRGGQIRVPDFDP